MERRSGRRGAALVVIGVVATGAPAAAQTWQDATPDTIGATAQWTNKVEVADLDGDGRVDVLFANGGGYASAGTPEPQRAWRNLGGWDGAAPFLDEISADLFGAAGTRLARVIKARDLDGDGDVDVFVGGAHGTASALYRNDGGAWTDVSSAALPAGGLHLGDAEPGDVDGDGDLDLVLADWGGDPFDVAGGPVRLWLNAGDGTFSDATARMPGALVAMSWDLELVDVDDDADLDVLVSCKLCTGGRLYLNDGAGTFTDATAGRLPQRTNNYDYEPVDLDGDGDLDLVTINDGPQLRETVLINDGAGTFTDDTATWLPGTANPANVDDNVAVVLDVDSDGDADLLIGALDSNDRVLRNDGGALARVAGGLGVATPGTLGLAAADLDGDGALDLVVGAGESASPDAILLAGAGVAVDTAAPSIRVIRPARADDRVVVARVHDHRSPGMLDLRRVVVELTSAGTSEPVEMAWRGEHLWVATVPGDDPAAEYRICATDAAGNAACGPARGLVDPGAPDAGAGDPDAGDPAVDDADAGGCCRASPTGAPGAAALALLLAIALGARRPRRSRRP